MSAQIGFVYLLGNIHMPHVYKIGCTERSPHARAEELSNHSGVPAPFYVICYVEVRDFQQSEKRFHQWLKPYRISENREFFEHHDISWLAGLFYYLEQKLSCSISGIYREGISESELKNPWAKEEAPEVDEMAHLLKIVGGGERDNAE